MCNNRIRISEEIFLRATDRLDEVAKVMSIRLRLIHGKHIQFRELNYSKML